MTPVTDDETENLELFTHNQSARDAVDHARKVKTLTGAGTGAATVAEIGCLNFAAASGRAIPIWNVNYFTACGALNA